MFLGHTILESISQYTPLKHELLRRAARAGDTVRVLELLDKGADPNRPDDTWPDPQAFDHGRTAMHIAAAAGSAGALGALIENGGDVRAVRGVGQTPLSDWLESNRAKDGPEDCQVREGGRATLQTLLRYGGAMLEPGSREAEYMAQMLDKYPVWRAYLQQEINAEQGLRVAEIWEAAAANKKAAPTFA